MPLDTHIIEDNHDSLRRVSAPKRKPEQIIKARLKTKFNSGWNSLDEIRQEMTDPMTQRQMVNVIMDSMVSGFCDFMAATRMAMPSYTEIFEKWNVTAARLGNASATYGELFTMYCFEATHRNHIPTEMMIRLFQNDPKLARRYSNLYSEIIIIWENYITKEIDTRDHETLMAKLKEHDSSFEKKTNGFVATPFPLAREMISKIPLTSQSNVLDPACGRGTFLLVAQKNLGNSFGGRLFGIDKDASKAYIAGALLEPYTDYAPTIFVGDALEMFTSEGNSVMPKFDAVVGNPPYNTPRNDAVKSADLYPDFIHLAAKLAPNVTMVTPSRWFAKNKNNNRAVLRHKMVYEYGLREIVTIDSSATFGIDIRGGVSYFVLGRGHEGDTLFDGKNVNLKETLAKYDAIVAENDKAVDVALSLVDAYGDLSSYYHGQMTFNIMSNHPLNDEEEGVTCLFSKQNGGMRTIVPTGVKNIDLKDKWKVVFSRAVGDGNETPDYIRRFVQCLSPGSIVSQSFIFFSFDSEVEQKEFFAYITSSPVLNLVVKCKITQDFSADSFRFVPNIRDASLLERPLEKAA